jgi:protocatechuate 3,4-dioxygenase alpha subunit
LGRKSGEVRIESMIEIWQADAAGRYAHPGDQRALPNVSFRGFGRCGADKDGFYSFETVEPGAVPGPSRTIAGANAT